MVNELSTVASYYVYFAERQQQKSEEKAADDEDFSWVPDPWSRQDELEAEALLHKHLEKSSISSLEVNSGKDMDTGEAWDKFYQDNGTRFFKDRHYFAKAFPQEFGKKTASSGSDVSRTPTKTLVEIGCGVGNACLPLLEEDDTETLWKTIHAMDISAEAITLMKQDDRFLRCNRSTESTGRSIHGYVCDISQSFPSACVGVADVATLLFCLSALDPDDEMPSACRHVASSLRPGGVLIVRDYGRYDEAQMKLGISRNKRIKENFYRKHDGTRCYYFSLEDLERFFHDVGLQTLEIEYLRRAYGNKASGISRRRVWVQARFVKPFTRTVMHEH